MRVAFVYRNMNRSASLERDGVYLVEGLAARGIEIHCYCDPNTSAVEIPGVRFHDVEAAVRSRSRLGYPVERLSFAARATRALRRDRAAYDIVHVLGVAAWEHDVVGVPAVMAAEQRRWPTKGGVGYRAAGVRAVLAPVLRPEVSVVRGIERLQFRPGRYQRVTAVSAEVRDDLVAVHGVPADRIDILPPPIDVSRFANATDGRVRTSLNLAVDSQILLFVGHHFERKGLADAIEALPRVRSDAHLVVLGGGDRGVYVRQAEALGVTDRVHFVGSTTEPERFYAAADVAVVATRSDPWGIPVIEAMAAGIPVVTTDAAGAAAVARDSGAGIVVPARAPALLASALDDVLRDPARCRELGERGRAAAGRFDVAAYVDNTLATYEHALAAKGKA